MIALTAFIALGLIGGGVLFLINPRVLMTAGKWLKGHMVSRYTLIGAGVIVGLATTALAIRATKSFHNRFDFDLDETGWALSPSSKPKPTIEDYFKDKFDRIEKMNKFFQEIQEEVPSSNDTLDEEMQEESSSNDTSDEEGLLASLEKMSAWLDSEIAALLKAKEIADE